MRDLSVACRAFLALALFSIAGTALTVYAKANPGPIAPAATALTILVGAYSAFEPALKESGRRAWLGAAAVLALTSAIEICGLYTGLPFGRYEYTDRWRPTIPLPDGHRFPLLLPFAWLLIAGGSYFACCRTSNHGRVNVILAAGVATAIDAAMEPLMAGPLRFWTWTQGRPGEANHIGWFCASLLSIFLLSKFSLRWPKTQQPLAVLMGLLTLIGGLSCIQLGAGRLILPLLAAIGTYAAVFIATYHPRAVQ